MMRMKWLIAAGAATAALVAGTGGALAYDGPPWAPGSGTQVVQQDRQQDMIKLHEELGVPAGQPLQLQDGTGPHGPGGVGPADCPYSTAS